MDYELAKQLKAAGFPQTIDYGGWFFSKDGNQHSYFHFQKGFELPPEHIKQPTLEELIEALGIQFDMLYYRPTGYDVMTLGRGGWFARRSYPINFKPIKSPDSNGSSPTEAVAKLWLALHAV